MIRVPLAILNFSEGVRETTRGLRITPYIESRDIYSPPPRFVSSSRSDTSTTHIPESTHPTTTPTMRYAVFITGPAGAGKSTFCSALITHAQTLGRTVHLMNLDPAADKFDYEPTIDIRELISLNDVMDELEFGPNGGLVYCFE